MRKVAFSTVPAEKSALRWSRGCPWRLCLCPPAGTREALSAVEDDRGGHAGPRGLRGAPQPQPAPSRPPHRGVRHLRHCWAGGSNWQQVTAWAVFQQRFSFFVFRERGREGEGEGEKQRSVASCTCADSGPNLQPRPVPWLRIEPVTFCFVGMMANQLSHTSQGFWAIFDSSSLLSNSDSEEICTKKWVCQGSRNLYFYICYFPQWQKPVAFPNIIGPLLFF